MVLLARPTPGVSALRFLLDSGSGSSLLGGEVSVRSTTEDERVVLREGGIVFPGDGGRLRKSSKGSGDSEATRYCEIGAGRRRACWLLGGGSFRDGGRKGSGEMKRGDGLKYWEFEKRSSMGGRLKDS